MKDPFQQLKEVMERMTPKHRQNLIDAHRSFSRLRSLCEARGYVEIMPKLTGIKVLKNTPEVKELKEVIDFLQPGGFKWEEIGGSEKKSEKQSAES